LVALGVLTLLATSLMGWRLLSSRLDHEQAPAKVAPAPRASTTARQECRAEVVRPDRSGRSARFVTWLLSHPEEVPGTASLRNVLAGPKPDLDVLIADIDNDGADEYIVVTSEGSGGYLTLLVYRPSGEGWKREEVPDNLGFLVHGFSDPLAEKAEAPLVRFCGQVFVTLAAGEGPNHSRAAYLWQGKRAQLVCDAAWLREQRRFFQTLFDHQLFDQAYGFLNGAQAACEQPADRSIWLSMQNDLALTAYRMGTYSSCLEHVATAQRSPGFASAGEALRTAIATNAALCTAAQSQRTPRYDYSWLRELKRNLDQQFVLDRRFNQLLSAAVPDLKFENGDAFRDVLKLNLYLPEKIDFIGDRYVVLAGCRPHDCGEKGLIWVDLATQRSIALATAVPAAFFRPSAADSTGGAQLADVIAVGSTTIEAPNVPPEFWEAATLLPDTRVMYAGPSPKWQEIEVPGAEARASHAAQPESAAAATTDHQSPAAGTGKGVMPDDGTAAPVAPEATAEISDAEKLAACAGDFAWGAIVARDAKLPSAEDMQHLADWFQRRAMSLIGEKALKIAIVTAQYASEQARKSGMQEAVRQEMANTAPCVPLVTRLLPYTKACFQPWIDPQAGGF
jgi:hypothetical protein